MVLYIYRKELGTWTAANNRIIIDKETMQKCMFIQWIICKASTTITMS